MASIRLFTGDDGQSYIEEIDPASHPDWNQLHGAQGIVFRASPPGCFSDWHVASRRQYIITLSGEAEIGLADGTVHWLGPVNKFVTRIFNPTPHSSREPLNKSVTWILNPTRRSCEGRNLKRCGPRFLPSQERRGEGAGF